MKSSIFSVQNVNIDIFEPVFLKDNWDLFPGAPWGNSHLASGDLNRSYDREGQGLTVILFETFDGNDPCLIAHFSSHDNAHGW